MILTCHPSFQIAYYLEECSTKECSSIHVQAGMTVDSDLMLRMASSTVEWDVQIPLNLDIRLISQRRKRSQRS